MRVLAAILVISLATPAAFAQSSQSSQSGMESARRGSQIASDGIKRSQDGKPVEGAALFGSGAASASIGASAAIAGRTQSGAIASKRSARDWSGPLKVSDDTVVAQPVPQVPFEPTQPPKPEPAPEATPEPQAQ